MKATPSYLRVKFGEEVWSDEPNDQYPADFINRDISKEQSLSILHARETRRAIWLFGERRSGKSSMLKMLLEKLKAQKEFLAIEIPWQSIFSLNDFYKEFLHQLDKAINEENILPQNPSISFWDSLDERRKKIGQRVLVIGIDEIDSIIIDRVDENSKIEILGCILRLINSEPNTKVILTSVREAHHIEEFKSLVPKSEAIQLAPFLDEDIDKLVRGLSPNISNEEAKQITEISGGWPYYAKAVLYNFLAPSVTVSNIEQARRKAVKSVAPTCDHLYRHHWGNDEKRALWLLANKYQIQPEEFSKLNISIRTALRELSSRGYVINENDQYRLRIGLISDWLQGWTRREVEEEKLEIQSLIKKLSNPWIREEGEQEVSVTKEELRQRGLS